MRIAHPGLEVVAPALFLSRVPGIAEATGLYATPSIMSIGLTVLSQGYLLLSTTYWVMDSR